MPRQTWWGDVLKPLNSKVGQYTPGWGTTPLMAIIIGFLLIFLVIILEIYNSSIILDSGAVSWTDFAG
jgi:photosystem II PsbH protein